MTNCIYPSRVSLNIIIHYEYCHQDIHNNKAVRDLVATLFVIVAAFHGLSYSLCIAFAQRMFEVL